MIVCIGDLFDSNAQTLVNGSLYQPRCARINEGEEALHARSIDRVARAINYLPVPLFRFTQGTLNYQAFRGFRLQPVIRFE